MIETILFGLFCGVGYYLIAKFFAWFFRITESWKEEAKLNNRMFKETLRDYEQSEQNLKSLAEDLDNQRRETERLMRRNRELHEYIRSIDNETG